LMFKKRGFLYAGLVYCSAIWGATFFVVKDTLADCHPVALVGWRFLLSAALLLPFIKIGSLKKTFAAGLKLSAVLGALYLTQTWGLQYTAASNSGFITGLFIVFVPLMLLASGKHSGGWWDWAATALAVSGLWLVTGGVSGFNRGDALTVIAAVCYAGHVLLMERYIRKGAELVPLAFHQFWMIGALCAGIALAGGYSVAVHTSRAVWTIVFLAVFPNALAFFIQMAAQRVIDAARVSLIFALEPVFAAVFAWTLGGEKMRPVGAAGGALIVAAIMLDGINRARSEARVS